MRFLFLTLLLFFPVNASAQVPFQELLSRALANVELDGPIDQWSGRARLSALIPNVVLDGSRKNDASLGSREKSNFFRDEKGDLLHEWTQAQIDNDQDTTYDISIRLQWNFRQLVFHPDELASEGRAARKRQQKLMFIEKLSSSFARFKVLEKARRNGKAKPEDEAILLGFKHYFDGLTDGWFSRRLRKKK